MEVQNISYSGAATSVVTAAAAAVIISGKVRKNIVTEELTDELQTVTEVTVT